jgi:hypothetical protein
VVSLFDQKTKREPESPAEIDVENGFELEPAQIEIGSGYTLQVSHDQCEHPIVDVKTYGKVDVQKLRREIERVFPNAHIRQMSQAPTVTVAKTNRKKPRNRRK